VSAYFSEPIPRRKPRASIRLSRYARNDLECGSPAAAFLSTSHDSVFGKAR
jgi:hypothetical protein